MHTKAKIHAAETTEITVTVKLELRELEMLKDEIRAHNSIGSQFREQLLAVSKQIRQIFDSEQEL